MKAFQRLLGRVTKWTVIVLVCVEVLSFVTVTVTNYVVYGLLREGARVHYDPYALFLNNDGIRPTHYNGSSPDKEKNRLLWLFGGSTMRGSTTADDKTIPSFLAKALNREPRSLHFAVVNMGEHSFNSLLEANYLQKLLIESAERPDLILFYDGANEAKYLAEHRSPYGHHGYRRFRGLVESYWGGILGLLKPLNAAVYTSFTKELYDKAVQVAVPLDPDSELVRRYVDLTEKRYDYLDKVATDLGARFLLVLQPCLWVETDPVSPEVTALEKGYVFDAGRFPGLKTNFVVPYQALAKRLKGKTYFVDFRNVLCDRRSPTYQADGVHLNDRGRRMVADTMERVLRERMEQNRPHAPAVR